jgi:hypothetical protein
VTGLSKNRKKLGLDNSRPNFAGRVPSLYPPRRVEALRDWLATGYPEAQPNTVGVVAWQIDGHARELLGLSRGIKVALGRPGKSPKFSVTQNPQKPARALKRLAAAIRSGDMRRYEKAWCELPQNAIALIDQVRGRIEWTDKDLVRVTGLPIPAPNTVKDLLPEAVRLASLGRLPKWQRDVAVAEIGICFEKITSERPRQASKAGTAFRSGKFGSFLDDLERFYNAEMPPGFGPLKFGVQKSGRATTKIFRS